MVGRARRCQQGEGQRRLMPLHVMEGGDGEIGHEVEEGGVVWGRKDAED